MKSKSFFGIIVVGGIYGLIASASVATRSWGGLAFISFWGLAHLIALARD